MAIVPERIGELMMYAGVQLGRWEEVGPLVGLTPALLESLRGVYEQADAARAAASAAEQARMAAFDTQDLALAALRAELARAIAVIKTTAQTSPDPVAVLAEARIPPAAPRSPAPPPGTPTNFSTRLNATTGQLHVSFECKNPRGTQGTVYEVSRRVGSLRAPAEHLGTFGAKRFTDTTLPRGAVGKDGGGLVQYLVTAVRSTRRGGTGSLQVNFGVDGTLWNQSARPEQAPARRAA